jgi:hypothetical protein
MKDAKAIVAVVAAVVVVLAAALSDDMVTSVEWLEIAAAVVGAVGVYLWPNKQPVE